MKADNNALSVFLLEMSDLKAIPVTPTSDKFSFTVLYLDR